MVYLQFESSSKTDTEFHRDIFYITLEKIQKMGVKFLTADLLLKTSTYPVSSYQDL